MPMTSQSMMALTTVAMMVAMMLPSLAPTLWRYHSHLRAMRMARAAEETMRFAAGYASVWTAMGLALFAMSAELSPMGTASAMAPPFVPSALGAVLVCAGVLQRSRWKTKQLLRCHEACLRVHSVSRTLLTAWREGCQLGVDCVLSCAAPMAVLFVAGLMDPRMMVVITAAITAERVAPGGARIARVTGALALIVGVAICVRTIEATLSGAPGEVAVSTGVPPHPMSMTVR
jgi:predicted metal-binding membrane protein